MAAASNRHLRAVDDTAAAPAEPPRNRAARKPRNVAEAAKGGDRLELLCAMRDRIAKAVADENCPPRDLAALTRRLDDIVEKIAVLEAAQKAEADDAAEADDDDDSFDASAI